MSDHWNRTTTMDIAVCFDCSLSMSFYSNYIRRMILSIFRKMIMSNQHIDIRMALVEFQSHHDRWITQVHPFTSSIDEFEEWMNAIETKGENFVNCKAIADAFDVSLTLDWRANDSPHQFHENLLILITDGPPCNLLSEQCRRNTMDLWQISNELEEHKIKLVVIGIEPCILECDDFYCALAQNTGGEYIPLVNASHILSTVLPQAIHEADSIRQALRHIDMREFERNSLYNYSLTQQRVRPMIKYCRTMAQIRDQFYTYRSRSNESDMNVFIDDEHDDELFTPPWNWTEFERSYSKLPIFTSTPTTDDEGYRTRLPTTASADSSFMCFPDLSLIDSYGAMDNNGSSEIDDQSI